MVVIGIKSVYANKKVPAGLVKAFDTPWDECIRGFSLTCVADLIEYRSKTDHWPM